MNENIKALTDETYTLVETNEENVFLFYRNDSGEVDESVQDDILYLLKEYLYETEQLNRDTEIADCHITLKIPTDKKFIKVILQSFQKRKRTVAYKRMTYSYMS